MILFFLLFAIPICAALPDKVLICGIARNVEAAIPNTIHSAETLGSHFADYRIILYENNSHDQTKKLFSQWAKKNPKVLFLSEKVRSKTLVQELKMKMKNRTEILARARNIVLDRALDPQFDDYRYIIWADLDFLEPWDIEHLLETITHPEQQWDAVFAYGAYDLFALRSEEWPIGFELLGLPYFDQIDRIKKEFVFTEKSPWKRVYSAFGGLAIYQREAVKGCHYSGVVTPDLEIAVGQWLQAARKKETICFLKDYETLLAKTQTLELKDPILQGRDHYPEALGLKMANGLGKGQIVWFSCTPNTTLPWTCEHIPLHASMILKGKSRLFINPKLRSNHP